ncbi:WD40 repeat domain-containing protein [Amycolatopsis sp. lyj-108]|uniref:WD40 repeat domain-containing protein n=1 Tax=Amycolatopsis sp. lyj-108 TaxID=2789286 RepID=UPI00397C4B0D
MHVELELRGEVYNLMRLAAVPGGPLVACADSESWVQLWDVARGATHDERRQMGETAVCDMAVVTIGGRPALAVCGPRAVSVWDLATFGTADVPLREYEVSWAMGMAAIPATDSSAELLVTAEKDVIRIVDPATGEQRSAIRFPETPEGGVGNRVYKPTGVRFADGTAGFAVDNGGRLEVWRLDADGKLNGREFGLSQPFRGVMTPLRGTGGQSWLAVAVGRGIEIWDLDGGELVGRGELDTPVDALVAVPLGDRTLVALASRASESGVRLWDPASRELVTGLFNRHGPAFGNAEFNAATINSLIAVTGGDGAVRIATCANDGMIRVSRPVRDMLTPPEKPGLFGRLRRKPKAEKVRPEERRDSGGNFAMVRDRSGGIIGIWLASIDQANDERFVATVLYGQDLTHLMGRPTRIVPNTIDDRGGAFVLFD